MLRDQLDQRCQFRTPEADVGSQRHGRQPELRVALGLFHVNMRRLLTFVAEEEEPETSDVEDGRHSGNLPGAAGRRQQAPGTG